MKEFFKNMIDKPHIVKKIIICFIAVCIMGMCISWLNLVGWGTDPCSGMNIRAAHLLGLQFGNYQIMFNIVLFVLVIIFGKENIGIGSVLNMVMVGYSCDFMNYLREKIWPGLVIDSLALKIVIAAAALLIFVISCGIYMAVELGTAPYDAVGVIIFTKLKKIPFRFVRMGYDFSVILITIILGGTVGVVTLFCALLMGPVVSFIADIYKKMTKEN